MHLLRIKDGLELMDVEESTLSRNYAILSHTWLDNESDEVTFQDLKQREFKHKPGYSKLQFCSQQAEKDGFEYVWIDTCCIDKSSSELLQQAITKMFAWYRDSGKCYALLTDVSVAAASQSEHHRNAWETQFRQSRWFTRGWTLQELLAPKQVEFYSAEGTWLGDKHSLENHIHDITHIPHQALRGDDLSRFTVEERFSWAKGRNTKRPEDKAYCLLGIFNIFLLHNYGEGDNAWKQLRKKIYQDRDKTNEEMRKILGSLPHVPEAAFNSQVNGSYPICLPDTRTELLQELDDWINGSDQRSLLWLNGIAGTGKSTVARTVCRRWYDKKMLGASFFFSTGNGEVSSSKKLVTTLAWQLAHRIPAAKTLICEAIRGQEDIINSSLRDQWEHLILRPLSRIMQDDAPPALVLVIDALDECDEKNNLRDILESLDKAKSLENLNLKVLITSRPEVRIRALLKKVAEADRKIIVLHEIPPAFVERDILVYFEEKFSSIREHREFDDDWPGWEILRLLVRLSKGLFIWAATVYRFVQGQLQSRGARKRLQMVLDRRQHGANPEEHPEKALDEIYTTVLRTSIGYKEIVSEKLDELDDLRNIIGSIAVLRIPLSMASLSMLLDLDVHDVKDALVDLHPIFQISYTNTSEPVRLHHPAFRDYLLDKNRCRGLNLWVDEKKAHELLASSCIRLMSKMLKRDICDLGAPGTFSSDIDPGLIKENIPTALQYACLYWADHYRASRVHLRDDDEVHQFVQGHYLHWLEAMSLVGRTAEMGAVIRLYHSLLTPRDNARQIPFISDARLFLNAFDGIMERAPLQTYCAALTFLPPRNQLKHHFRHVKYHYIHETKVIEADLPEPKMEFNYVCDLAFSPDGSQIVAGSNLPIVRLWNTVSRKAVQKFEEPFRDKVSSVAISPDGTLLAAGADDWTVSVWNLRTGRLSYTITAHQGWVNSVVFSPDGRMLATGAMDDVVILTRATNGHQKKRIDNMGGVNSVSFSLDSAKVAAASVDRTIKVWSVATRSDEIPKTFDGHSGSVNSVRYSPNGKNLVSGSDDLTVKIWDVVTEHFRTLRGHTKKVWAVTYSPDARLIVSGSEDKTVRIWDANNGAPLRIITDHMSGLNSVSFSQDGRYFASSSFDDVVQLYDGKAWKLLGQLEDIVSIAATDLMEGMHFKSSGITHVQSKGHSKAITCIAFSPDYQTVASGSGDTIIKLWSVNGTEQRMLNGHIGGITRLQFSPDSSQITSTSLDCTIKVWDAETGDILHTLPGHTSHVLFTLFSPDGRVFASCSTDGPVRLWDTVSWTSIGTLEGHLREVRNFAFSPNNALLASCSADATIRIWNVSSQAVIAVLTGHTGPVTSVAFSPDNESIVTTSEDNTVRLWGEWKTSTATCDTIRSDGRTVASATFSPDGQLVTFCTAGNVISIWNRECGVANDSSVLRAVIQSVAFSADGKYIETDRGILEYESLFLPVNARDTLYTYFVADDWLLKNSEAILWLPEAYRASFVAIVQGVFIIGHSSGAISFVHI